MAELPRTVLQKTLDNADAVEVTETERIPAARPDFMGNVRH
jgi:hypothetical protein